jgi:Tfp pilus assembly protein PilF
MGNRLMNLALWMTLLTTTLSAACVSTKADTPESRNQLASLELARQMVGQGEYHRAVHFLSPRSRHPDAPAEVHMLLGLSFIGLSNPEAASKSFQTVINKQPENDDAQLNLAYTYILTGKNAAARNELSAIVKRGKYLFLERVHLNMGLAYLQEKRCDKATTEFKAALEIDPTYSAPYFNLGKCQLNSGRLAEAKASFQRAVDFCPGCLEPQLELAGVAHRLGDRRKALDHLDAILKAKPDPLIEKRALALRKQITR